MSLVSLSPLEQAIYNWLVPAFVPTAIFARQRVKQPAFPYASILLMASAREGGRDIVDTVQDLTRVQSVRITPTQVADGSYVVTIDGTPHTYVASGPTASTITGGLAAALAGVAGLTVVDNHGTLDISKATAPFLLTVSTNLAWANRDAGHELVDTAYGSRRLSLQITFHGDETSQPAGAALERAESAGTSLSLQPVIDTLLGQGVAIVRRGDTRDVSQVINGQWVSRAQLDVVFRTVVTQSSDGGYIGHVTATGDVDGIPVVLDGP